MTSNRRKEDRFGSDMIFWIKATESDEAYHPFEIENISAGGVLCRTKHHFNKGANVTLEFELPQHTDLIGATAEIRHAQLEEDGHYRVGIQFTKVEGVSADKLTEYLEDLFR